MDDARSRADQLRGIDGVAQQVADVPQPAQRVLDLPPSPGRLAHHHGPRLVADVGEAVQAWIDRREMRIPGQIDGLGGDGVPDLPGDGAVAQRMGADGIGAPAAPGSAAAIRSQLSDGRPLDSTVRTRMERGGLCGWTR